MHCKSRDHKMRKRSGRQKVISWLVWRQSRSGSWNISTSSVLTLPIIRMQSRMFRTIVIFQIGHLYCLDRKFSTSSSMELQEITSMVKVKLQEEVLRRIGNTFKDALTMHWLTSQKCHKITQRHTLSIGSTYSRKSWECGRRALTSLLLASRNALMSISRQMNRGRLMLTTSTCFCMMKRIGQWLRSRRAEPSKALRQIDSKEY